VPSLRTARAGVPAIGAVTVVDTAGIIRPSTQPRSTGSSSRGQWGRACGRAPGLSRRPLAPVVVRLSAPAGTGSRRVR
jgi:hypothetical protein